MGEHNTHRLPLPCVPAAHCKGKSHQPWGWQETGLSGPSCLVQPQWDNRGRCALSPLVPGWAAREDQGDDSSQAPHTRSDRRKAV